MKKILILICLLVVNLANAQTHAPTPAQGSESSLVKWMSLKEAMEKNKTVQKPILIDFYTDWCGWCKHMMKTTYSEPDLAQYINNYFYPVKFDAEGKDTIEYLGKIYKPTSPEPKTPHELAKTLLNNNLVYPTTLFLNGYEANNNAFRLNMIASGFLDRQKLEPMLVFSLENVFRNCSYDDFNAQFQKAFYDSSAVKESEKYHWMNPKTGFAANTNSKKPKKTLVVLNTKWCNSCRVFLRTSLLDNGVRACVDSLFNIIDFDIESTDTLNFNNQQYINAHSQQAPFHQLALQLTSNNLGIPTFVILDENQKVMDAIRFYLPPATLLKILKYFGEDINKKMTWEEYAKLN